jgi:hypothetical protein
MPKSTKITNKLDTPVLIVKLQKGLADRQMLPLDHVIRVLEEVRQMIIDAGREVQTALGMEKATREFGLELVAGERGILFQGGSVQAQIAITANTQNGVLAARHIVNTVNALGNRKYSPESESDRSIVRRLNRIAKIQQTDKTELQIGVAQPGSHELREKAIFGEAAAATAWSIQAPVFQMEGMVLYGKLYELKDADTDNDDEPHGFWGELHRDNGEVWRIQFKNTDLLKAAPLFRQQVSVKGVAKYYRIAAPKLIAADISLDKERDYEAAFEDLVGCDKGIYPKGIANALKQVRGDD